MQTIVFDHNATIAQVGEIEVECLLFYLLVNNLIHYALSYLKQIPSIAKAAAYMCFYKYFIEGSSLWLKSKRITAATDCDN